MLITQPALNKFSEEAKAAMKKVQDAKAMTDKKPMQTEAQKTAIKKAQDELTAAKAVEQNAKVSVQEATKKVQEAEKKLKQLS